MPIVLIGIVDIIAQRTVFVVGLDRSMFPIGNTIPAFAINLVSVPSLIVNKSDLL